MKTLILAIISSLLFSCTQKENMPMGEQQIKQIKEEIQPVISQIIDAAAHTDTAKLFEVFSFSDNFTYVEISGVFYDPAAYKKMVREFWGQVKTEIIGKGSEKYVFLSDANVLWSYSGSVAVTFKNEDLVKYEPFGLSMLFRKENDKWKVVFIQESSQVPNAATSKN